MEMKPNTRVLFLLCVTACAMGTPAPSDGPFDVILRGGWIVDGSGNPRYRGDVGIRGDRIVAVGFLAPPAARGTLGGRGPAGAPRVLDLMGQLGDHAPVHHPPLSKETHST